MPATLPWFQRKPWKLSSDWLVADPLCLWNRCPSCTSHLTAFCIFQSNPWTRSLPRAWISRADVSSWASLSTGIWDKETDFSYEGHTKVRGTPIFLHPTLFWCRMLFLTQLHFVVGDGACRGRRGPWCHTMVITVFLFVPLLFIFFWPWDMHSREVRIEWWISYLWKMKSEICDGTLCPTSFFK